MCKGVAPKNHPERPHIRLYSDGDTDEVITYLDLWNGAELVAAGLQHFSLEPGESVLMMLPTGPEYFYIPAPPASARLEN